MFIISNAWRSVMRNKGRNILIVVIVAIIAAAATIGLAIRNAAQTARDEGLAATGVTATIGVDRESMIGQARQRGGDESGDGQPDMDELRSAIAVDALTLDDYERYADAASVDVATYYTEQTALDGTDDLQPVSTTTDDTSSDAASGDGTDGDGDGTASDAPGGVGMDRGGMGGAAMSTGDFTVTGFSSDTAVANAANGTFTMSDGQVFGYGEDGVGDAIITAALAEFNGIEVGDTITLADPDDDAVTYELTVVGVYSNDSAQNVAASGPMGGTGMDPDNAIYTSTATLEALGLAGGSSDDDAAGDAQLTFTYVLGSADDYETFVADVEAAGLGDGYTVSSADVDQYESSLVPLDNLASFALTLLLIVLAVGAVVLIVINLFNVRERKYEVGVLLAIGIRKVKVAAQFVVELLIVTMIGIALGVVGGAVASVPVADQLLAQQIATQQSQTAIMQTRFGRDADMSDMPGGGDAPAPDAGGAATDRSGDADAQDDAGTQDGAVSQGDAPQDAPADAPNGVMAGFAQAAQYVDDIDATVDLAVVGRLVLIGLALTLVSALAGIVAIVRYEPLQILADRS